MKARGTHNDGEEPEGPKAWECFSVTVDGEKLNYCIEADEEAGYAVRMEPVGVEAFYDKRRSKGLIRGTIFKYWIHWGEVRLIPIGWDTTAPEDREERFKWVRDLFPEWKGWDRV